MRFFRDPPGLLPAGSSLTLSRAQHRGRTVKLDTAGGSTVILPPALGDQCRFKFVITTLGSPSHIIKVANALDVFRGILATLDSDLATVNGFAFVAGATSDTITLAPATTGGANLGEWLEVEDIALGIWHVRGTISAAAPATPFSATVS